MFAENPQLPGQRELKGRVLIVEDDLPLAKWMTQKLSNCGMEVDAVADASSAAVALSQKRYHAVVSDVYFGELKSEGLHLINQIQKMDIPVIAVTARADLEVTRSCLKAGVHRFLEKPFEINDLISALGEAWENPKNLSTMVERFLETNGLTPTERKIAKLALKGLSNREIAGISGNTEKTVKFHMTVIYDKCGVGSRGEFFNSVFPT